LNSVTFDDKDGKSSVLQEKKSPLVPKFNWETAERVDAKYQFINQGDLVFINFNFKGYNKDSDARYSLSDNEILLEVRDVAKNKVHRMCKTLTLPINCQESSAQLLVDFIVFKLKKCDKIKSNGNKTWDDVGYDIQEFHLPESNFYMRSNFLKQKTAQVGETNGDNSEGKENQSKDSNQSKDPKKPSIFEDQLLKPEKSAEPEKELTEEEKAELAQKQEQEAIERMI